MSEEKEIIIEHPMESLFDIEPGTTEMTIIEREPTNLVVHDDFDDKDREIEGQIQEVFDAAMTAFETQTADSELIEPKYKARNQEVAVQFLNTALSALKEKSTLKQHKDKITVDKAKANTPGTVNNNLIIDRNDLLKKLMNASDDSD